MSWGQAVVGAAVFLAAMGVGVIGMIHAKKVVRRNS